jgi:5S rRNA maturation endonuclease (ribonuclease M5)
MERRWNPKWQRNTKVYSEEQVAAVIEHCGISIAYENATHFIGFCPFHPNSNDPAFEVDKNSGLFCCFNPACSAAGTLENLAARIKDINVFEFARIIQENRRPAFQLMQRLREAQPVRFVPFPEEPLKRMHEDFRNHVEPQDYMYGRRGFTRETMEYFEIGYSVKRDMIIVPMHDPNGVPVGFVGRSREGKVFKNSDNLPKSMTAWNFHRAKRCGDTVIVVESSFTAMQVHQAGYPNVVALLGGSLSVHHIEQLDKTFSTVIIMTDADAAGRKLGWQIHDNLPWKKIKWATWSDTEIYPDGAKDPDGMQGSDIVKMLRTPVSSLEYRQLDLDRTLVVQ